MHECKVIASMLEDDATGRVHYKVLQRMLDQWKTQHPAYVDAAMEDRLVTAMSRHDGSVAVLDLVRSVRLFGQVLRSLIY